MKNLKLAAFCLCLTICNIYAFAQNEQKKSVPVNEPDYSKPKLFADLPDRINFDPTHLLSLLSAPVGQSISVEVTSAFTLSGLVVSKASDQNSASVVLRLTNRPGARLIFTKLTGADSSVKYIGRIISLQHGDSYEIISENGQYYFKKKGIYELVSE